jgi:hypothetical protein
MVSGIGKITGWGSGSRLGYDLVAAFSLDAGAIPMNFSFSLRFFLAPLDKF